MKNIIKLEKHNIKRGMNSSKSIQAISKTSFTILMFFWIVGCGSGGSGGSDGNSIVPNPVVPGPVVPNPVVPNPVVPNPVVPNPVVPNPVVPNPVVPNPVVPGPVVGDDDPRTLSQLYGRILFGHSFSGDETFFIYDGVFGPEDLVGDNFDDLVLIDTFASVIREDQNSDFVSLTPVDLICGYIESTGQFLCNVFFESGASDNFLFGTLVDNESIGNYTFCSAEITVSECIDELVGSPDGTVLVSVISQTNASLIDLENLDAAKKLSSDTSVLPYLEYENQGTLGSISDRSSVSSEIAISIMNAFEEHKALTKPVELD